MPSDATEALRLRIKLGPYEFDAEGSRPVVEAHLEAWKKLIVTQPLVHAGGEPVLRPAALAELAAADERGPEIVRPDHRLNRIVLLAHPAGKRSAEDALLLILYGCQQHFGEEGRQARAALLNKSLAASGFPSKRIDRLLAHHIRNQLVATVGARKSTAYRLTSAGHKRAEELLADLRKTAQSKSI